VKNPFTASASFTAPILLSMPHTDQQVYLKKTLLLFPHLCLFHHFRSTKWWKRQRCGKSKRVFFG